MLGKGKLTAKGSTPYSFGLKPHGSDSIMKAIILIAGCLIFVAGVCAQAAPPEQRLLSLLDVLRAKNVLEEADYRKIVDSGGGADASLTVGVRLSLSILTVRNGVSDNQSA